MNLSVDLVLIVVNLLALAYSYGRFSEKIGSLEKQLVTISKALENLDGHYYSSKDGVRLEQKVDACWKAVDHIKEEMVPSLRDVIIETIERHSGGCAGFVKK